MKLPQIHFVDGEKGGIGKSFFCRTLVDYCLYKGFDIHVVDADTSNPDVSRFYPEISTQLAFSQKESLVFEADQLCQLALSKPVIVNLPAQIHLSVKEWMEKNYLLAPDDDLNLEIYKWFVCTGSSDSINLFLQSLADYAGGAVKHVLVKNLAYCQNWDFLSQDLGFVQAGGLDVPSLEIGVLAKYECIALSSKNLTFNAALNTSSPNPSPLWMMSRKRVYDYFHSCRLSLDALSLIQPYSPHIEQATENLPKSLSSTRTFSSPEASRQPAPEESTSTGRAAQQPELIAVDF